MELTWKFAGEKRTQPSHFGYTLTNFRGTANSLPGRLNDGGVHPPFRKAYQHGDKTVTSIEGRPGTTGTIRGH